MNSRKVALFISMSLDGFIATQDDDISWLSKMEREGEDYGYQAFTKDVDTYIVGRKTYDKVIDLVGSFPQAKQFDCYVLTRSLRADEGGVTFYNGSIKALIESLQEEDGGTIYCDGGGEVVKLFMEHNLIDEYIISIIPIILGEGKRLFCGGIDGFDLNLIGTKSFDSGLVQLHYKR